MNLDVVLVVLPVFTALVALMTFFSGFGLGTLLMPAFALFLPVESAVALTALVHLANNLFKVALVGRAAVWPVVWRFGLPALAGALVGAAGLHLLAGATVLWRYELAGAAHAVTGLKLTIAVLMLGFAAWEALPRLSRIAFPNRWWLPGALLTGFFGGLSGHQGAMRAAVLLRLGLERREYVATGVLIALLVDAARLASYGWHGLLIPANTPWSVVLASVGGAFAGSALGARWLTKATHAVVRRIVAGMLVLVAVALGSGMV